LTPYGGTSTYAWSASNLPPGLSINSSGVISGTPSAAGFFNATITLTDVGAAKSVNVGHSLTVDPFAITTGGVLPQGTVGTPYNQTLTAPDCGSGCTWSIALGGLASGLSLSSGGVLSGTPMFPNNSFFTAQASGSNGIVQKVLALQIVSSPPQPLAILS